MTPHDVVSGRLEATPAASEQPLSDGATSVLNLPITVSREDRETDLTRSEAEACLQRLRDSASITWQWVTKAYLGRAWLALGYVSWDAMCDGELGGMRLRLPREERREIVGSLRDQGMSTRAIGAALGVHHDTVANDLGPVGNPTPVTGLDGKTYTPPARVDRTTGVIEDDDEVVDAEIVEDEPVPSPERPAAATSRAPRTDVVGTVNVALSRARDAADAARQISPAHLRDRGEEAAVWARDLSLSIEAMSGLLSRLQEATQ